MGVVNDAIEDGIGQRRIADDLVPTVDRHLAGDHDGTGVISVLDDLQQIAALLGVQRLGAPIVEHQQIDAGERVQMFCVSSVTAGEREGGEQARHAVIEDGQVFPAGLLAEGASEPAFANAAGAGDQ